ncbi:MAG: tRNA 2-thiocytidine(32) synthetase TtcA [Clostridia bacterium]|nr:tRNA 2-thiocytidine(32) synthetase TtcA [Clostridia bacterium]
MDYKRQILSYTRRAVDDYKMINEGDKIAVGVSAGKDSLTLLCALAALKRFYPAKFELEAITVDMGFEGGADFSGIARLCSELDVPYTVVPSDIAKIVFDIRKEPNPCSLCAKLRRGALNNAAKERGCTTVALGHHWDDAVETFMLNLFFEGRIGCFSPVTYLSRVDLTVIRPMIYMPEKTVSAFARQAELPVIKSSCPADKSTEREQIKALLQEYEHRDPRYRGLRNRIFNAMQKAEIDGFKLPDRRLPAFSEEKNTPLKSLDPENES